MTTFYTVYRTTNTATRRFYIGVHKTTDPNDGYLGSGHALKQAVKKYGRQAFVKEVLFSFDTAEEAYAKERELVTKELIESGEVYNIATGGVPSIDWGRRRKLTALRGPAHPQYGKKRTEEQRRQTSETLRKMWAEQRDRMLEGPRKAGETRLGRPSPLRGTTQTAEANAKRSASHRALPKMQCQHCDAMVSPQNFTLHHGDKCPIVTGAPSRSKFVLRKRAMAPV